jgi:hypothetical protein
MGDALKPQPEELRTHDQRALNAILDRLEATDIRTWLAGGWAEELSGLIEARSHRDIDLLHPARDFKKVEELFRSSSDAFDEIAAKRFPHKRAFLCQGVMVELLLLQPTASGYSTNFWDRLIFVWPDDVLAKHKGRRVASISSLAAYRSFHPRVERLRRSLSGLAF